MLLLHMHLCCRRGPSLGSRLALSMGMCLKCSLPLRCCLQGGAGQNLGFHRHREGPDQERVAGRSAQPARAPSVHPVGVRDHILGLLCTI